MVPGGIDRTLADRIRFSCDQLAAGLQSGHSTRIEDLLSGWQGDERSELLKQLLSVEIEFRRTRQEDPSVDEFVDRFPNDAALVNIVFEQSEATIGETLIYAGSTSPQDFGEYTVLEKIGEGGMGTVFKARHKRMDRVVAIKLLPPKSLDSTDAVKRFEREVKAAARLEHPNVVTAYDAGEANGHHFLVMRYVDGQDLSAYVKQHGPLPVSAAANFIEQAARGLEYAHKQGVIHRDVKPSNLLLDRNGTIRVLDLGLARFDSDAHENLATELTQSGSAMGTVDYMAPEQSADAHTADVRSDIYSLGCTLYYLLSGKSVYGGATLFNRMLAHRDKPIPALGETRSDIPPIFDELFRSMVAKAPADRPQSMSEVITKLNACGLPEHVSTTSSVTHAINTNDALSERTVKPKQVETRATTDIPDHHQNNPQQETIPQAVVDETIDSTSNKTARDESARRFGGKSSTNAHGSEGKPPVNWFRLAGFTALACLLLVVVVLQFKTPNGTVKMTISEPAANVTVQVDGNSFDVQGLEKPLKFEVGEHTLKVQGEGYETVARSFTVIKGENPALHIELVPIEDAVPTQPDKPVETSSTKSVPFEKQRFAMERILRLGAVAGPAGTFAEIQLGDAPPVRVSAADKLPSKPFKIVNLLYSSSDHPLVEADLEWIATLQDLRSLYISKQPNVSMAALTTLVNLETLQLIRCTDADLAVIAQLPRLRSINLVYGHFTARGLTQLEKLPMLEGLGFSDCDVENFDQSLSVVQRLPALKGFGINGTTISDDVLNYLVELRKLEQVELIGTGISGSNLKLLSQLPELKHLSLDQNPVTDEAIKQLKDCTKLTHLNLNHCPQITDEGLKHFSELKKLTNIGLRATQVTDDALETLAGLPTLWSIMLEQTAITDKGLAILSKSKSVRSLQLQKTNITDNGLEELAGLESLTQLKIEGTHITEEGVANFKKLKPQCRVVR